MSQTKLNYSIFAGGYVLPTTGLATGLGAFAANDKIVIDENLNSKEENYVKLVAGDKLLLSGALQNNHDYHANIKNRFQGLKEISDPLNPQASILNSSRGQKIALDGVDSNNGTIVVSANESANRILIHETQNGSVNLEEIWLWGSNDSEDSETLYLEIGGVSSNNSGGPIVYNDQTVYKIELPPRVGVHKILPGLILSNSLRVTAYASSSNKINIWGHVNRIIQQDVDNPQAQSSQQFSQTTEGWGENFYGQANVPSKFGVTKVNTIKSAAAGYNNSFFVLGDDSIYGWGSDTQGQLQIPTLFTPTTYSTSLVEVEKVAIGAKHILALYRDSNQNTYVNSWGIYSNDSVPPNLGVIKDVVAGSEHSLALIDNGTVMGWGDNSYGQAKGVISAGLATGLNGGLVSGDGGTVLTDVVGIAAGSSHSLALRSDSGVVAWGGNWKDQCTVPAEATGIIQIAAGMSHSLALRSDGVVLAWGNDKDGQSSVPSGLAIQNTGVETVVAAGNTSLALMKDGSVIGWGKSEKLKNPLDYEIKSLYGGLEHVISSDITLPKEGVDKIN